MVVNNQITPYYAGKQVVIVGYDNPSNNALQRRNRYYANDPSSPITLPHLMVDSGHQTLRGGTRDQNYYLTNIKSMIDTELARPPQAAISAQYKRVGNHIEFTVKVTNQSGKTLLSSTNGAMVHAVVYETFTNTTRPAYSLVNNFGRVTAYKSITQPLANGATGTYTLTTADLAADVKWSNLHMLVMVDYRPGGSTGAYDMLQAAFAQPASAYTITPASLAFLVDSQSPGDQTKQIKIESASPALTWKASSNASWMTVNPSSGGAGAALNVTVTAGALSPGSQSSTITIQLADGVDLSRTEEIPIAAYLGTIHRLFLPRINS